MIKRAVNREGNVPNFVCSHCQQQSITAKQKLFLTAFKPIRCNNCDARLQMKHHWYGFVSAPYLVLIFIALFVKPAGLGIFWLAILAILASLLVHFYAPLKVDRPPMAES